MVRVSVIQALVNADLVWVAVVAVLLAVVGAFYYLRIVKLVYFDAPESEREISGNSDTRIVLTANVLLLIVILPWVGVLIGLCNQVIESLGYSLLAY